MTMEYSAESKWMAERIKQLEAEKLELSGRVASLEQRLANADECAMGWRWEIQQLRGDKKELENEKLELSGRVSDLTDASEHLFECACDWLEETLENDHHPRWQELSRATTEMNAVLYAPKYSQSWGIQQNSRIKELEARVEEEGANYVAMMDLRDEEIRKNSSYNNQIERLQAELQEAKKAGTPYWKERDVMNAYIIEIDRLYRTIELIDTDLREMRVRGVIDMPEMIRALRVISDGLYNYGSNTLQMSPKVKAAAMQVLDEMKKMSPEEFKRELAKHTEEFHPTERSTSNVTTTPDAKRWEDLGPAVDTCITCGSKARISLSEYKCPKTSVVVPGVIIATCVASECGLEWLPPSEEIGQRDGFLQDLEEENARLRELVDSCEREIQFALSYNPSSGVEGPLRGAMKSIEAARRGANK